MGTPQREVCNGLWRSEDMVRLDLILQREALHDTVLEIGMLGKAQFIDLNEGMTTFARPFTNEIRRCEDIQRKMRAIEEEYLKEPELLEQCTSGTYRGDYNMCASVEEGRTHYTQGAMMDSLEDRVESMSLELSALVSSAEGIYNEMNYHQEVHLLNQRLRVMVARDQQRLQSGIGDGGMVTSMYSLARLSTLFGVLPAAQSEAVTRLCYRISRGNAVIEVNNEAELLVDPKTGQREVVKATVVVIASSARIVERLRKLVTTLGTTVYGLEEVASKGGLGASDNDEGSEGEGATADNGAGMSDCAPQDHSPSAARNLRLRASRRSGSPRTGGGGAGVGLDLVPGSAAAFGSVDVLHDLDDGGQGSSFFGRPASAPAITDLTDALSSVSKRKQALLLNWYAEHRLYKVYLTVEKTVLSTMNMCALSGSTCTASLWVPCRYEQALQRALDDAVASSGSAVQSIMSRHHSQRNPPTFFETNKFTSSFQGIVDSYGMARYKEVNPGVFTIMTFPYLFGIMYGDIGHGIILLLFSIYLITRERTWRINQLPEILAMIYGGRYLLLLMALFATYMGFLYNDFFGFSLNIFKSGYRWSPIAEQKGVTYPIHPNGTHLVKPKHVYAVGLDVAWAETENKLEFYNSVKMKCAVIVGVVQMFAGLMLSLNNYIYERNWYKIAFKFVPEFIFLLATFGYMSIMIIVKWCTTWENTHDAPSILEIMTNFFLQPGVVPNPPLFKGQAGLQVFLLLIAFLMVPILLLGMPTVELLAYKKWKSSRYARPTVLPSDLPPSSVSFDPFAEENAGAAGADGGAMTAVDFFNEAAPGARQSQRTTTDNAGDSGSLAEDLISNAGSGAGEDFFGPQAVNPIGGATDGYNDATDAELRRAEAEEEYFSNFDFSEMMIHYIIHTIEYVLSSVSNTASYLRLWALSLAHAQLSEVFFTFAVVNLLDADTTGFAIGFGVFAWLGVTMGVLVGMEALSAFLHALRLHWVEFQNKFYLGDGAPFIPLDLPSLESGI